mmetsp:Transcript_7132/g.12809  ORF Transcript_7132/g.12809 Transcript_7132/m.12809 type:complete len:106 (+) Transcript_7132:2402-2719(+)
MEDKSADIQRVSRAISNVLSRCDNAAFVERALNALGVDSTSQVYDRCCSTLTALHAFRSEDLERSISVCVSKVPDYGEGCEQKAGSRCARNGSACSEDSSKSSRR